MSFIAGYFPESKISVKHSRAPLYVRAKLGLLIEQIWAAFWPAIIVIELYALLAVLGAAQNLPQWGLILLWLAVLSATFGMAWPQLRRVRWPNEHAAERRIEQASNLAHRPLATLADHPFGRDAQSAALWQMHLVRTEATLHGLQSGRPISPLIIRDPRAARYVLLLTLLAAMIIAGSSALPRLGQAVWPLTAKTNAIAGQIDLWITPPAYTGKPTLTLKFDKAAAAVPLEISAGSQLTAHAGHWHAKPKLILDGKTQKFAHAEGDQYQITADLTDAETIEVTIDNHAIGAWQVRVIPDYPPFARFSHTPTATNREVMKIAYQAADDYGVASALLRVRRVDRLADDPIILPISIPQGRSSIHGTAFVDLTENPWAGLPVQIQIMVKDAAGQPGYSKWLPVVLPMRPFAHPIARMLIRMRQVLTLQPQAAPQVARGLFLLAAKPALYQYDNAIYLNLIAAASELSGGISDEAKFSGVQDTLWNLALRLDQGLAATEEKNLRDLQNALRNAMNSPGQSGEADRLMSEFGNALDQYLNTLMQHPRPQTGTSNGPRREISREQLQDMLRRAQELMQNGQREAAEKILSQLRQILENLSVDSGSGQSAGRAGEGQGQSDSNGRALSQLRNLAERQRRLLDKSFRTEQNPGSSGEAPGQSGQTPGKNSGNSPNGKNSSGGNGGFAEEQGKLRDELNRLQQNFGDGEESETLGAAEQAMREAEDALKNGATDQAMAAQSQALQKLEEGAQALADKLSRANNGEEDANGAGPGGKAQKDPFGRDLPGNGGGEDNNVAIPDDNQLERSRSIFEELRRRAGDSDRSKNEMDYLERLLKRY